MARPVTRLARGEAGRAGGAWQARLALAARGLFVAGEAVLALVAPAAAQLRGSLAETPSRAPFSDPGYRVKPMDGAPTAPGTRRVIETFGAWTLICDEARRRRVCNAAQSIVGPDGRLAFSWSLAATGGGEPIFLVRTPVTGVPVRTVTLVFGSEETVIRLESCDLHLCLGFLPLNPGIVKRIRERGDVAIRYRTEEGGAPVAITASLDGLATAIGSIRR